MAATTPGEVNTPFDFLTSIVISLTILEKTLLFWASVFAFKCFIFENLLCPDISES
jgi:hypothetical protein